MQLMQLKYAKTGNEKEVDSSKLFLKNLRLLDTPSQMGASNIPLLVKKKAHYRKVILRAKYMYHLFFKVQIRRPHHFRGIEELPKSHQNAENFGPQIWFISSV